MVAKLKMVLAFAILVVVSLVFLYIRVNTSSSLPEWLFMSKNVEAFTRDIYVSFYHPSNQRLLLKKIVGLPGDRIHQKDDHLFVNDFDCGQIHAVSRSGFTLTPLQCTTIPANHVFVWASHPESFDSRYEEFGLVRMADIKEELWPLF